MPTTVRNPWRTVCQQSIAKQRYGLKAFQIRATERDTAYHFWERKWRSIWIEWREMGAMCRRGDLKGTWGQFPLSLLRRRPSASAPAPPRAGGPPREGARRRAAGRAADGGGGEAGWSCSARRRLVVSMGLALRAPVLWDSRLCVYRTFPLLHREHKHLRWTWNSWGIAFVKSWHNPFKFHLLYVFYVSICDCCKFILGVTKY